VAKRKAALKLEAKVTWYVIRWGGGNLQMTIGQFNGGEDEARAQRYAQKWYKKLVPKGCKVRVSREPVKFGG
jgi:hypothetical protein